MEVAYWKPIEVVLGIEADYLKVKDMLRLGRSFFAVNIKTGSQTTLGASRGGDISQVIACIEGTPGLGFQSRP